MCSNPNGWGELFHKKSFSRGYKLFCGNFMRRDLHTGLFQRGVNPSRQNQTSSKTLLHFNFHACYIILLSFVLVEKKLENQILQSYLFSLACFFSVITISDVNICADLVGKLLVFKNHPGEHWNSRVIGPTTHRSNNSFNFSLSANFGIIII